jgi:hypothetical protein
MKISTVKLKLNSKIKIKVFNIGKIKMGEDGK